MLKGIEECVNKQDIKGLRYIFMDSLDIDPTFENYREEYEYCKNMNGFFDEYIKLTEFKLNKNEWSNLYWEKLKIDLKKNFSQKRFEHMIAVAQIVYADKVLKLQRSRESGKYENHKTEEDQKIQAKQVETDITVKDKNNTEKEEKKISGSERNSQEMLAEIEALALENREIDKRRQEQVEYVEAKRKHYSEIRRDEKGNLSKKVVGSILIIAIIIVMILLVFLLTSLS